MPLRLRFFQNFVFFIFSLIKCRHKNALNQSIDSLKKNRTTRSHFNQPLFETNLYKFSVMSIAIRLLNSFIYTNVNNTETIFRSAFEKVSLTLYRGGNIIIIKWHYFLMLCPDITLILCYVRDIKLILYYVPDITWFLCYVRDIT